SHGHQPRPSGAVRADAGGRARRRRPLPGAGRCLRGPPGPGAEPPGRGRGAPRPPLGAAPPRGGGHAVPRPEADAADQGALAPGLRFGADAVLPLVLRLEAADAAKYRDVAEAGETMSAEEMAHGRAVAALGGGGKGEQIARSEGRHRATAGGALRAGVFGVNDGLLSNLLLIVGVAGGTSNRNIILLAGLAGLLAGAFSMAAGEWVSVQSQ